MIFSKVKEALEKADYKVSIFTTKAEASEYLNGEINGKTIGIGGSVTVRDMGLAESLGKHNTIYWHWLDDRPADESRRLAMTADIYLSSVNGMAETGEIINIDGMGNRLASTLYGHEKVYFIVGRNKIAPTFEEAMKRARNIASPLNAQRLNCKTPCAVKGDKCYNCEGATKICRAIAILEAAPHGCEYEVILIDEELGY